MKKTSPRRRARECATQAVYSWEITRNEVASILAHFLAEEDMEGVDTLLFQCLVKGAVEHIEEIDNIYAPFSDRTLDELGLIEKSILRVAVFELKYCLDVPYKVAINEAIEVGKVFGADDSHKFINGILDKVAPEIGRK